MSGTLRESLSEKLINGAAESALDRQTIERSLAAASSQVRGQQARGQREALAALRTAELFESVMLWLGWRLQPRHVHLKDRHQV